MSMLHDFRNFAIKGNAVDLAVGVIIGNFITILINFILLAFVIFMLVRLISRWKTKLDAAPPAPTPSEALLTEIRDLLKSK